MGRAKHRVALLVLGAFTLLIAAALIPLAGLAHRDLLTNAVTGLVLLAPFAVVGVLVARRQPRNPLGWMLLGFALCFLASDDAGFYLVARYRAGHHLPLAPAMLFVQPLWEVSLLVLPLVVLMFPDGRLPSPRWAAVRWCYLAICAIFVVAAWSRAAGAIAGGRIRVDGSGDLITAVPGWLGHYATPAGFLLLVAFTLSFAGRQVLSWRRSSGERREQLKWLVTGAAVSVVCVTLSAEIGGSSGWRQVISNILAFGMAATPAGIGIAILKYRLYDIDRIISRTLAYALVTGLTVGVYAGLVLLVTEGFSFHSPVVVAGATLVAAALFSPLRRRVQHTVDHRFNRARYDAEETVAVFAERLKDAVDLDAVRGDLTAAVQQALEPEHLSVWTSRS